MPDLDNYIEKEFFAPKKRSYSSVILTFSLRILGSAVPATRVLNLAFDCRLTYRREARRISS